MQARKLFRPEIFLSILPLLFSATLFAQYDQSYQGDPPASIARIGYLNGNVSLQPYGSDQWTDAPINYPMVGGDRLYTGPGSRAVVQLGGAEMRIWQATDVTLTNLSDNFEQIGLAQGALRLRVFQMDPGSQMEVDTPNGAALINSPGDYRIEAFTQGSDQGASSILTINSGNAQLTGPNINLPVSSGYSVGLFGQNPVQLQYLDVPDYDDLDYWSISLDQRLQRSVSARYVSPQMVGYGDLDANGTWSQDPEYGPVWYPTNVPYGWQPYSTGHWAYVQPWGYTWVDDAPWGFAPFHYGRWSQRGDRWGWFPGPPAVRPVYSPALVAFVGGAPGGGGGGISIGISFGSGGGGISAWFPIGVGEPYVPWYRCSPRYAQQVNVTNVNVNVIRNVNVVNNYNTYINKTVINNTTINNTTVNNTVVNNFNYSNRRAVTAVPINAVSSGAPVARQMVHLTPQQQQQVAQAPISIRPTAPQPVAAHPSLVPASNAIRPVARPTLMTPTGAARAVASSVPARPVAVSQLPPARIMPQTPPPPPAAPKPVQQNRVNQPVNASAPIRPVIEPAPVQRPVTQPVQQPVGRPIAQPGQQPVQQPTTRPVTQPAPVTRPVPQPPEVSRPAPVAAPPVQRPTPPQQPQPQPRQFTPPEQRPATPPQVNRPNPTPAPAPVQRPASQQEVRPLQPQQRPVPPAQQVKPQPEPLRPAPQVRPVTPPPQPQVQARPIPPQQVRPRQKPDERLAPKPKDEPKPDQKPD